MQILDLQPRSDPHGALTAYGPAGRERYGLLLVTFDILLPAALALTVVSALLVNGGRWARRATAVPLLGWVCDYTENIMIFVLLRAYPGRADGAAAVLPTLTQTKTALIAAGALLAVAALAQTAVRRLRRAGPAR
ncbi:hypothetical protein [Sinosporangium siamense]|uniref:Uncharacterized protein n=1 Tax=Sinosporangium siamense TaxID=1367973 RepID=A0A919VE78_9ACTN|nr:hypothetical protein [Sinosporangium siamense]GII94849.1 hypothetical protein Ssi02_50800 [Sinosporangium siamense]